MCEFEAYQPRDQNRDKKLPHNRFENGQASGGRRCGHDVAEPGGGQSREAVVGEVHQLRSPPPILFVDVGKGSRCKQE